VHNHAYKIIKYALDEILSVELAERAFEFWTSFVEPFFGLPPRDKLEGAAVAAGRAQQADGLRPINRKPSMRMAALSGDASPPLPPLATAKRHQLPFPCGEEGELPPRLCFRLWSASKAWTSGSRGRQGSKCDQKWVDFLVYANLIVIGSCK
jgi:hypothetical protein